MKSRSCLTNLISCYDHTTRLMDEVKVVDIIYLDFSKAITRVIESVDHKHEQGCYVPGTALPTYTLGLGTQGLVSR